MAALSRVIISRQGFESITLDLDDEASVHLERMVHSGVLRGRILCTGISFGDRRASSSISRSEESDVSHVLDPSVLSPVRQLTWSILDIGHLLTVSKTDGGYQMIFRYVTVRVWIGRHTFG